MSQEPPETEDFSSAFQPEIANDTNPDPLLNARQIMIWNEERKLIAGTWDRMGTACVTVGVATPMALWFYGPANDPRFA